VGGIGFFNHVIVSIVNDHSVGAAVANREIHQYPRVPSKGGRKTTPYQTSPRYERNLPLLEQLGLGNLHECNITSSKSRQHNGHTRE